MEQQLVIGNPLLDETDDPVTVNQVGDAAAAELAANAVPLVGDQRVVEAVFLAEPAMGREAVTADAQDLGIELFERDQVALKSLEFTGSDQGEVGIIEGQHQVLFPEQFADDNRSLGRFGAEQRYRLADFEGLDADGADGHTEGGNQSPG